MRIYGHGHNFKEARRGPRCNWQRYHGKIGIQILAMHQNEFLFIGEMHRAYFWIQTHFVRCWVQANYRVHENQHQLQCCPNCPASIPTNAKGVNCIPGRSPLDLDADLDFSGSGGGGGTSSGSSLPRSASNSAAISSSAGPAAAAAPGGVSQASSSSSNSNHVAPSASSASGNPSSSNNGPANINHWR